MNISKDSLPLAPSVFATTHWSVITAAQQRGSADAEAALEQLCSTYWRPVFAFVRRCSPHEQAAKDLTQGFFERFLEKEHFRDADQLRGRFRSFLLACVKNVRSRLGLEYADSGRTEVFKALRVHLAGARDEAPYDTVAPQLRMSVDAVKKNVERMRRRFRQLLRDEIAQTVLHPSEIEDELRFLRAALQS